MYSDRELLALAAKAAGLQLCGYSWIGENEDDDECEVLESAFVKLHPEQELATKWKPLTDDGDALRLAVKLGLDVDVHRKDPTGGVAGVEVRGYVPRRLLVTEPASDNGDALFAATRRAIVRAAAAIGETMQ